MLKKIFGIIILITGIGFILIGTIAISDIYSRNNTYEGQIQNEFNDYSNAQEQGIIGVILFGCGVLFSIIGIVMVSSKTQKQKNKEIELEILKKQQNEKIRLNKIIQPDLSTEINHENIIKKTSIEPKNIVDEITVPIEKNIVNQIENKLINNFTENEIEYIDEVKFLLEDDGIIDVKEKAILQRLRNRIGISEKRAQMLEEIEYSAKLLNDNEKVYFNEYYELKKVGKIAEKEQQYLNRLALKLKLSSEKIIELEKITINT